MSDTAETPYIWMSADHVPNMAELHQIMVAVHPDTGHVLDPQPEYPKDPEPDVPPDPPVSRKGESK